MSFPQVCTVRIYIGSGVPSRLRAGRYAGQPTAFDSRAFTRFLETTIPKSFQNATQFFARGLWLGGGEDSVVVEVFERPNEAESCSKVFARASKLAQIIARKLGQDAVMVITTDARGRTRQGLIRAPRRRRAA